MINIKADRVVISSFRIENYASAPSASGIIKLYRGADGCIISNNDISQTENYEYVKS